MNCPRCNNIILPFNTYYMCSCGLETRLHTEPYFNSYRYNVGTRYIVLMEVSSVSAITEVQVDSYFNPPILKFSSAKFNLTEEYINKYLILK